MSLQGEDVTSVEPDVVVWEWCSELRDWRAAHHNMAGFKCSRHTQHQVWLVDPSPFYFGMMPS